MNPFAAIARKVRSFFSIRPRSSLVFGDFFDELEHRHPGNVDSEIEGPVTIVELSAPFDPAELDQADDARLLDCVEANERAIASQRRVV